MKTQLVPFLSARGAFFTAVFLTATLVSAQTLTTLRSGNVADGGFPHGGLTLGEDGMLYGINGGGGTNLAGTVFKVSTNGTEFAVLHHFAGGSEGTQPVGRVAVSGNTVYGVTYTGGNSNGFEEGGTIYRVNTDGSNFSILRRLDHSLGDGWKPLAGVGISGDTVFGTCADGGGVGGRGVVFRISTNGAAYKNLHVFKGVTDGQQLEGELVLIGNTVYGNTTYARLAQLSGGTLFKVNLDGSGFATLHTFTNRLSPFSCGRVAQLTLVGNEFYGAGYYYDLDPLLAPQSCIYKINTNGTGFQVVALLPAPLGICGSMTWNGSVLVGAAWMGDSGSFDRIFQIRTDGTEFHIIKTFGLFGSSDPSLPMGNHVLIGNSIYGTALYGGEFNGGSVYRLDLRPNLVMATTGAVAKVSWPSYAYDYQLQQSPALSSAGWSTSAATIGDDGTNRFITISPARGEFFYRLIKP